MTYRVQIDDVVRDATPEEAAAIEAAQAGAIDLDKALRDAEANRASAVAKLKALGLNAAEIQALVG